MLPANVVSTHTVFCLKSDLDERSQWCLLGLLNSLVANYLVRLNVTTHVTAALMSRLPVPDPRRARAPFDRLVALARSLASTGIDSDSRRVRRAQRDRRRSLRRHDRAVRASSSTRFPYCRKRFESACFAVYVRATEARKHGSNMIKMLHEHITDKILGCAIAVHRGVGPGLAEQSYQAAMALEMTDQGLRFEREPIHRGRLQRRDRSVTIDLTSSSRTRSSSN